MSGNGNGNGKRVALVLGSGGARGLAHIGVIEHLLGEGYEIEFVCGCSMGAVVGGVFAGGKLETYRDWVCGLERKDVFGLLDFAFGTQGLFKGERIIGTLKEMIGDRNIEDLDVGFTAVATDLHAQKEVWINRGPLFDAIRASIAIPTVFTPTVHHGRVLVDGGLLNPVPIAPALSHAADMIVAVNLNARPGRAERARGEELSDEDGDGEDGQEVPGFIDQIAMSIDTMQGTVARMKLAAYAPDLLIDVPRDACLFYEFHKAKELIALGRERAEAALARMKQSRGEDEGG